MTQESLATKLNLSHSTISRALAHDPRISRSTRTLVQQAASDLGYNRPARVRFRRPEARRNLTIGVVLALPSGKAEFLLHSRYVAGIRRHAEAVGVNVDLFWDPSAAADWNSSQGFFWRQVRDHGWRGAVLVDPASPALVEAVAAKLAAVVLRAAPATASVDTVSLDEAAGLDSLLRELARTGNSRAGWLVSPAGSDKAHLEFRDELIPRLADAAGIQIVRQWETPFATDDGAAREAALGKELVQAMKRDGISAWLCTDRALAVRLAGLLAARGIRAPEECVVACLDMAGEPTDAANVLALQVPAEEMGAAAASRLLDRLAQPQALPCRILLPAGVVPRTGHAQRIPPLSVKAAG